MSNYTQEQKRNFRANQAPVTMGDPDGPPQFIVSLDQEVGTFTDPRQDLKTISRKTVPTLMYHVPYSKRGIYKPEWLPEEYRVAIKGSIRTDLDGFVICAGVSRFDPTASRSDPAKYMGAPRPCAARAVNRCGFCRHHGGALHPLDKKMSAQSSVPLPADRVAQLDRVQKFMQGLVKFEELDDDEVIGAFIRNDQGTPIASVKLGDKIHQGLTKELFKRMNRFMQMKLPNMLKVISDIAESDTVEPADRHKAAVWMAERVLGKNPEVVLLGKAEAPYETILSQVQSGSREEYRRATGQLEIEAGSSNGAGIIEGEIVSDDDDEDDYGYGGEDSVDPTNLAGTNGHSGSNGNSYDSDPSGLQGNGTDAVPLHGDAHQSAGVFGDTDGLGSSSLGNASQRVEDAKSAKERIKKARSRRFAARAVNPGLRTSVDQLPWIILFTPLKDGSGWRGKLYSPDKQTERIIDEYRIQSHADESAKLAQLAGVAAAYAASLTAKIGSNGMTGGCADSDLED